MDLLWQAAGVGLLGRIDELLAARAAERLLDGEPTSTGFPFTPESTPVEMAVTPDTRREELGKWLGERELDRPERRCSARSHFAGTVDLHESGLRGEPLARAVELARMGGVLQPDGAVGQHSASPADRHPPVRLRSVMLVQLRSYTNCFG